MLEHLVFFRIIWVLMTMGTRLDEKYTRHIYSDHNQVRSANMGGYTCFFWVHR